MTDNVGSWKARGGRCGLRLFFLSCNVFDEIIYCIITWFIIIIKTLIKVKLQIIHYLKLRNGYKDDLACSRLSIDPLVIP